MNLVLLSGSSRRGEEWLKGVEHSLNPLFDRTYRHNYAHWESGEPEIDLECETELLAKTTKGLEPYMIFAKSAGTILTSKATAKGVLQPKAGMFVGFPLVMVRDHHLPADNWLKASDFPLAIAQHSNDPFGSYVDVKKYITGTDRANTDFYELPGNSHDYTDLQALKDLAGKILQNIQ